MEKFPLSRLRVLFKKNTPYQITRSFALKMLPLSFLVGLFICFAIPIGYYFVARQEVVKQAELHAAYIASIFRETLEMYPLVWKERIQSRLIFTKIRYVKFYDPEDNLIAEIGSPESPSEPLVIVKKNIKYAGHTYASVEVGVSLADIQHNAFRLLFFSLFCGTVVGLTLFLLPVFEIQAVEDEVNKSKKLLLAEQEKLKRSEEKYRTLFELAPDGNVITTEDGCIISCNQSFLKMLNINEDIKYLNIKNFYLDPKVRNKFLEELYQYGEILNKETIFKRADGSELPVLLSMRLISSRILENENHIDSQTNFLIFNIIRDITEIKKIEKQLIQAQKLESIGLFAGGIAHDFNNILAGILGYTELLKMRIKDDKLGKYIEAIEKSATRASGLVKNLLAFARADKYQLEIVNLNEIVEEVSSFLEHTLEKKISLIKELDPGLHLVKADPSQINQVLLNLCVNARDALLSQGGGKITIKTFNTTLGRRQFFTGDISEPGSYAVISVSDNGPGMEPEVLDKIFDPFFTTKRPGEGTGLGLSVVYGIVRNHGGFIDVISEPGQGAEFIIYLPSLEEQGASVEKKEKKDTEEIEGARPGETILLIDDEEEVRNLGKIILEEKGYRVLVAKDGLEGIKLFRENGHQIDLVLLDLIMPKKDGVEVFKELKKLDPSIKIILVTGYALDKDAQELRKAGADAFVTKPYRVNELLQTIRQVLG